jgi:cytochrome b561
MFISETMHMSNQNIKYDLASRSYHWLSALVILWATFSGFLIISLSMDENTKHQIEQFNIAITAIFIPVFFLRIVHRLRTIAPPHNEQLAKYEVTIAKVMHTLLYVLVSTVLVSGILMMEHDIHIFSFIQFDALISNKGITAVFKTLHDISTRLLAIGILLHLLALIKHEVLGHRILKRMI